MGDHMHEISVCTEEYETKICEMCMPKSWHNIHKHVIVKYFIHFQTHCHIISSTAYGSDC